MTELPPPDAPHPPVAPAGDASDELRRLVRRKVFAAVVSIVVVVALVILLTLEFQAELDLFTLWVFDRIGLIGLAALLFVSDAAASPVPPDAVLLLISNSPYHAVWPTLVPALGLLSGVAGWVGYFIGRRIAHTRLSRFLFQRFKQTSAAIIHRYGPWGVVLGAVTPLPFSVTCWTAGMLEIPFRRVALPCLLRIPRFVVYYLAIAYAETLANLLS